MKTFCLAGPIIPTDHYFLPQRLNYPKLEQSIKQKFYFVLHGPRQSGKTTAIEEFVAYLNNNGNYAALHINIESAQAARDNIEEVLVAIVELLARKIEQSFNDEHALVEELEKIFRLNQEVRK